MNKQSLLLPSPLIRYAKKEDLDSILYIYNQGIEDRIATLESETKERHYIEHWFEDHQERYAVLVAEYQEAIVGWASLNRYSQRCAYDGVADLSIYIKRDYRRKGIGSLLLSALEQIALKHSFHKIILFTFPFNAPGQKLYEKLGYRTVGIFEQQGVLDGQRIDVEIKEKILN